MTNEKPYFDEVAYWLERHEKLKGNLGSVGKLGIPKEQQIQESEELLNALSFAVKHLFPNTHELKALDLASGIGRLAPSLVELGFDYTGIEISPLAIEQAKSICPNGEFIEDSVVNYTTDKKFDLVVASYIFVHLVDDSDWEKTFDNILESLKPNGICLLFESLKDTVEKDSPEHVKFRDYSEYQRALLARGLFFDKVFDARTFNEHPLLRECHVIRKKQ